MLYYADYRGTQQPNTLQLKTTCHIDTNRFLGYGIIETFTYYLIIMLIWDETEAQNISQHQLNRKMVQNIKKKSADLYDRPKHAQQLLVSEKFWLERSQCNILSNSTRRGGNEGRKF